MVLSPNSNAVYSITKGATTSEMVNSEMVEVLNVFISKFMEVIAHLL